MECKLEQYFKENNFNFLKKITVNKNIIQAFISYIFTQKRKSHILRKHLNINVPSNFIFNISLYLLNLK